MSGFVAVLVLLAMAATNAMAQTRREIKVWTARAIATVLAEVGSEFETPGVELVGPLPPEIQSYVTFTAGVCATSKAPDVAEQLIKFLTGPTASAVIRAQGMEPHR